MCCMLVAMCVCGLVDLECCDHSQTPPDVSVPITVILTICSHDVEFLHASLHHLRRVSRDIVLVAGDRMHDGRTAERLDVVKSAVAEHSDVRVAVGFG
jgi:hypothetical protein